MHVIFTYLNHDTKTLVCLRGKTPPEPTSRASQAEALTSYIRRRFGADVRCRGLQFCCTRMNL